MENRAGTAEGARQPDAGQRRVRLRHAKIGADGATLHRTAQFSDGSTGAVEMKWSEVRRVAAFRRDVMTQPVLCVAITDPRNVVVLDESMEGWRPLIDAMSKHLAESPSFTEWRERIGGGSEESHWTVLFSAVQ